MTGWHVFIWGGLAFCALAVYLGWRTRSFLDRADTAQGRVVRLAEVRDSDGELSYAPVVRFRPGGGTEIEFTDSFSSMPASNHVGQWVAVAYDPAEPSTARVGGKRTYFAPVVCLVIGAGWFALGYFGLQRDPAHRTIVAAPRASHVEPFVGAWRNVDTKTGGITRIVIEPAGSRKVDVKRWGRCRPADCDWGKPRTVDLARADAGRMGVTWNAGFAVKTQSIERLADGRLQVVTHTKFTDGSGRRDYTAKDLFQAE